VSTENPIIRNFDGLEGLEELASRLRLKVRVALGIDPTELEPGSTLRLPAHDLRKVGLELAGGWELAELEDAAAAADIALGDVAAVVVAEDGFLKERRVVLGPVPAIELLAEPRLAGYSAERDVVLQNSERGFSIEVHFILVEERPPRPYRPHRKGTILASARFAVRSTRDSGGIDPRPLTEEKIEEFGLSKRSVLFLDHDGPLVQLEHLDGSLDVYINEELLAAASHHRGNDRDAVIGGLAAEAMCQLVYIIHQELQDTEPPTGDRSAVLRMVRRSLADVDVRLTLPEVAEYVKNKPAVVAGLLSGVDRRAQRLLSIVAGIEDEQDGGMS